MHLGYSTYAMKELDVFEVLPRLRAMGYDTVEIAVRDGWATAAGNFDRPSRIRLAKAFQDLGFPPPPLMDELPNCLPGPGLADTLRRFEASCILAEDLNFRDGHAVITSTVGGLTAPWEEAKQAISEGLLQLADMAEQHGVILALEPHVGNEFDTPEKAVWVMEETRHPSLKLNFDISHFHVQGLDLTHCVKLCSPYAVHTHIKDGCMKEGKVRFLLPGEGNLDLTAYMLAMKKAGSKIPITVEVSAMIWTRPDYDPWWSAQYCYRVLDEARKQADAILQSSASGLNLIIPCSS